MTSGYRPPAGWTLYKCDDDRGWVIMDCGPVGHLSFGDNLDMARAALRLFQDIYEDAGNAVREQIRDVLGVVCVTTQDFDPS